MSSKKGWKQLISCVCSLTLNAQWRRNCAEKGKHSAKGLRAATWRIGRFRHRRERPMRYFFPANCSDLPSCRAVVVANSVAEGKWRKKWCPHLLLLVGQSLDGPKKNFLLDLFSFFFHIFFFFFTSAPTRVLSRVEPTIIFSFRRPGQVKTSPRDQSRRSKQSPTGCGPPLPQCENNAPKQESLQRTLHISVLAKQMAFGVDKLK